MEIIKFFGPNHSENGDSVQLIQFQFVSINCKHKLKGIVVRAEQVSWT